MMTDSLGSTTEIVSSLQFSWTGFSSLHEIYQTALEVHSPIVLLTLAHAHFRCQEKLNCSSC